MKLFEAQHIKKYSSNKVEEKPVYLLNKQETVSERDRIERLYDIKKQTKDDEQRMKELTTHSMRSFNTLLSRLTEAELTKGQKVEIKGKSQKGKIFNIKDKDGRHIYGVDFGAGLKGEYFEEELKPLKENSMFKQYTNKIKEALEDGNKRIAEADSKGNALFNQGDVVQAKGMKQNGKVLFGKHDGTVVVKFPDGSEGECKGADLTKLEEADKGDMRMPYMVKSLHNKYKADPSSKNLRIFNKYMMDNFSEKDQQEIKKEIGFKLLDKPEA